MASDLIAVSFKFEGPDLEGNSFNAEDLGAALQGIGELFSRTDQIANGQRTSSQVKVRADFRAGNFEFFVDLVQTVSAIVVPALAGTGVTAFLNAYQLVQIVFGNGNGSLLDLFRFLAGSRPHHTEKRNEKVLVYKDGTRSLEIYSAANDFFEDSRVRNAMAMAVADSLSRPGVESLTVSSGEVRSKILQSERNNFYLPPKDEDILAEEVIETELEVVGVSFEKGNKWDFRSYKDTFTAEIADEEFWSRVHATETFKRGDRLKVILKIEFYRTEQQVRKRRTVVKVLKHLRPEIQLDLEFPAEGKPSENT